MSWHDNHLGLVSFIGKNGATRSNIEHIRNGYFADKLSYYIEYGIISVNKNADSRDDFFILTDIGSKLWRQEIRIEDILNVG